MLYRNTSKEQSPNNKKTSQALKPTATHKRKKKKTELALNYLRVSTFASVLMELSKQKLALIGFGNKAFSAFALCVNFLRLRQYNFGKTFTCTCRRRELPTHMASNKAHNQPQSGSQRLLSIHEPRLRKPENRNPIAAPESGPISRDMKE